MAVIFFALSANTFAQTEKKKDTLKENKIEEVVVTALGITKKKEKIGYSTQEVNTKQFENITTPSVSNLFSGQVSGLNVSNPPGMQQTPIFTLRGNTNLIIVIDGVIVDSSVYENLNPNNIENINVLKGATASALYGSRGRYGAVLITTKNAKKKGFSVEFSQNIMVSAGFTNLPKTQTEFGNGSQGKYEFWDGADGGINDGDMIWGPRFREGLKIAQWNSPIRDKQTGEIIQWYGAVTGTQYDDRSRYERVPIDWKYHDNLNIFLKPAVIHNNNLSVAYKNENNEFRLAANYQKHEDKVPEAFLRKAGFTFSTINKITPKLTFDSKVNYNNTFTPNIPNYDYNPSGHMYTILIWMGADVDGHDLRKNLWIPGQYGIQQANWNYAWYNNPWFGAKYYKNKNNTDLLNAQTGLKYDFSSKFSVKGKVSIVQNNNTQEILSPKSYFNYSAPREGGYQINKTKTTNLNYDVLATYKNQISDNIDFTVNAGGSGFYYKNYIDNKQTDGLTIPEVYTLENSTGNIKPYQYLSEKLIYSLYSSVDFGFYNSIYLNLSGRNDWSSTLPKENRSYFYPSASISAVISNMVKMPEAINLVKLSASWAKVSYDFKPYDIRNYYNNNAGATFNGLPMYSFPNKLNFENSVKPEKTRSYELGLSLAFLKNRISFDATYFNTLDYDNILEFPAAQSSGYQTQLVNGNKYTNQGIEISLGLTPIKTHNFTWKSLINWSTFEQRLTEIYGGLEVYKNLKLNERTDSYYDIVWKKSPDGKVILDANTGMPTRESTPQNLGHLNPDWTFGFTNNFKYKNLTLSVGIDGSVGGIMRSQVVEKMWWGGKHPNSVEFRDREYATPGIYYFVPDGVNYDATTGTYTPHTKAISFQDWAQNYPYRARVTEQESKQFANIFDKTFVKLRSVSLAYDFTRMLNPKGYIKNLTVHLSGYNLWMWKKSKNLYSDPDYKIGTTAIGTGGTSNTPTNDIQDPSSRWIGLGFNVKF
ncbi:MAG: SusC/RagA family TonB-linked outer membrane protein [Bergeyella zoohelcum]|nr:SusC/RagA family TonB-linked outer membrane protein [Bergeyella zoohelcum]